MESAKHWELPGEELGTGTRRSENHLNGGIDCISSFVPHSNWGSKSTKFDDLLRERRSKSMLLKTLQDMSGRPPLIVYEQNTSPKARGRATGRLQGERRDAISLEREASRACCRGDPVTVMNVEEWGIFLVTAPMFRRTNAAGGVQNRPAEDGRVHVVEPRAREALKVSESRKHSGGSEA
ncbi:unnamed protein product [Lactuca saligna]|uniref:Uncharacterized protein n=1 Tax=Lactuca saligna TaxID=75948 RepID=A0AA35VQH3_LACSI|nr:unnamed protein product [Lactuca saligna]